MDIALRTLDWSLIQSFLAVADSGSLSAAARALGQSQPTLGRQIAALEEQLGATLFTRHARGLRLTDTGAAVVDDAQAMRDAMNAIKLKAAGKSNRLEGSVRITASVFAAQHVMPPIIAQLRAAEPAITIDLVPTDDTENLLFREADIAVRMFRPDQLDIITQFLGELELGTFAAKAYLDRRGRPKTPQDLLEHDLVGYDQNDLILRTMRDMGWSATRETFGTRCDNQATYWQLLRAGCGIGFCQRTVACADPLIEEIELGLSIPPLPVWLAAHQAMRNTPRIRRIWDLLATGLKQHIDQTDPSAS